MKSPTQIRREQAERQQQTQHAIDLERQARAREQEERERRTAAHLEATYEAAVCAAAERDGSAFVVLASVYGATPSPAVLELQSRIRQGGFLAELVQLGALRPGYEGDVFLPSARIKGYAPSVRGRGGWPGGCNDTQPNGHERREVMKRSALMLVVVGLAGSLMATGCSRDSTTTSPSETTPSEQAANAVAPEETPATAPVDEATNPGVEKDARSFHYYAPHAPPARRVEVLGRAPSERHFWAPGYYRWNGREHVWVTGRWELRRPGYEYEGPRWVTVGARWEYLPGHWVRR